MVVRKVSHSTVSLHRVRLLFSLSLFILFVFIDV